LVTLCKNCEQFNAGECGDTGVEVYDDPYCGKCSPDECVTCKYKSYCPVDYRDKQQWGIKF